MSNYKYCADSKICLRPFQTCNPDPKKNETFYTRETGCPITKKCQISVDGNFFIDYGLRSQGGLDTSTDGQIKFEDLSLQKVKTTPDAFPCAMVFHNLPKKELTF